MYDEYGCAEDERRARDFEHVIANSEITDKELLEVMINSKWNDLISASHAHADVGEIYDVLDEIYAMQEMIKNNKAEGEWEDICNEYRYALSCRAYSWTDFENEWN